LVDLGSVTQDTETGLDWLDFTATNGSSVNEILAGSGGWVAAGWSVASGSQACSLLVSVKTAPDPCPGVGSAGILLFPFGDPDIVRAIDLLGVTDQDAFSVSSGGAFHDPGQETGLVLFSETSLLFGTSLSARIGIGCDADSPCLGMGGVAMVRLNSCDPSIPGSCQGNPLAPTRACQALPDGRHQCSLACSAECIPCAGDPCARCSCEWSGFSALETPIPSEPRLFAYEAENGALFISIDEFPLGSSQPFTVLVDGQSLGSFQVGDSVDFSLHPVGGVARFQVLAEMDEGDPNAFGLVAPLDTDFASFRIAVPEPSGPLGLVSALALLLALARGRRRA
jgi:hypothetical protein